MGILLSFISALILGFAAHRASLCTVKAVAEVVTVRRFYILTSFIKTSIWIAALSVMAITLLGVSTPVTHWPLTGWSIGGGLLFGVGAAINGGCTFSTLTRIGDGDLNMSATVVGWIVGAWTERSVLPIHHAPAQQLSFHELLGSPISKIALIGAAAWILWQAIVMFRPLPARKTFMRAILAPSYKLSIAAALIASANLIIYDNLGPWSFTSVILSTTSPATFPPTTSLALHWAVLAFVLLGMTISSRIRGNFSYSKLRIGRLASHGSAGIAMGFGAAMIPGGNDSLILYGVGFLSPHALPAFISILAGIAFTFVVTKRFGANPPTVYCTGDICVAPQVKGPARPRVL
ncbi:YeeE/YedE thiosulfate transporter family protein [Hyphococcus sp.]|uniref:YeeE/YedE thiosulfate transporter family protein n=1 Tax=Hyphococcus sp. TaxID=2038636 RepID=UPI00207E0E1A|nr:MAG: sulfur transporter [Marinicaulis sp.]